MFHPNSIRRRLVRFGFRRLYNELACLYDPVSWLASLGRWRSWQATIWPYLPPEGWVLEVGCGPGHLLADLGRRGYRVVGLDLSPAMLRIARRRLQRQGLKVPLCRAKADALPFTGQTFAGIVATFPTSFVYEPGWIEGLLRVLKAGGRLIVVETASLGRRDALVQPVEWLYRIAGRSNGPAPDLPRLLGKAGLTAWRESAEVNGSTVELVVAEQATQT